MFNPLRRRKHEEVVSHAESTRDVISEDNFPKSASELLELYKQVASNDSNNGTTYAARMRELFRQFNLRVPLIEYLTEEIDPASEGNRDLLFETVEEVNARLGYLHGEPELITAGIDAVDEAFDKLREISEVMRSSGRIAVQS